MKIRWVGIVEAFDAWASGRWFEGDLENPPLFAWSSRIIRIGPVEIIRWSAEIE